MTFPDKYPNEELLKKIQKEFIITFIGEKYENLAPKEAANKYETDYIADYMSLENIYKEEPENSGAWMNYEQILDNKILFNKNDFFKLWCKPLYLYRRSTWHEFDRLSGLEPKNGCPHQAKRYI